MILSEGASFSKIEVVRADCVYAGEEFRLSLRGQGKGHYQVISREEEI